MLIQLIEAKNETPANSIDPTIDFKEHNWALGRCSDGTIFQFLQWSALAQTQYEALVDSFIFSPSPCGHYCICTVQGGISCYCSTFLMLRLMSLLHTSISFQIKSRIISLGMENNLVFSHCLFSFVLLSLSLSFKHTLTRSHTYTTTPSPPACGVTNFSWALDFSLRETEKEKMKERAEAVVHWQLRGSHPHWRSLIPPHISSFWSLVCQFCPTNQCKPRATSMCVASFGLYQFLLLFTPQFQVLETHHKQRAWCSHLWGEIEF